MNDRRKIEILRVALDAIAFEAKEPAMRVYAQSALDQTKDLPKEQEQNSHCEKHSWYGLPDEKCPICEPYAKTPVSGRLPCYHNYIQKDTWWKSCTHCGMIAPLGQ